MRKASLVTVLMGLLMMTNPGWTKERASRFPAAWSWSRGTVSFYIEHGYEAPDDTNPNGTWTQAGFLGTFAGQTDVYAECELASPVAGDSSSACGSGTAKITGTIGKQVVFSGNDTYSTHSCDVSVNYGERIDLSSYGATEKLKCTVKLKGSTQFIPAASEVTIASRRSMDTDQASARSGAAETSFARPAVAGTPDSESRAPKGWSRTRVLKDAAVSDYADAPARTRPNGTWTVARKLDGLAGETNASVWCSLYTWDRQNSCGSGRVRFTGKIGKKVVLSGVDTYSTNYCDTSARYFEDTVDLSAYGRNRKLKCIIRVKGSKQKVAGDYDALVRAQLYRFPSSASARTGASEAEPSEPRRGPNRPERGQRR